MTGLPLITQGADDMKPLANLIASHEDWLVTRVHGYAKKHGFTQYTSTLVAAWQISISGLSAALLDAIETTSEPPEFKPDDDYTKEPVASFGILEAQRHRARGITLGMFLGLMKYYRQGYVDLVLASELEPQQKKTGRYFVDRFFDRVELGLCTEWGTLNESQKIEELQAKNREVTNEKNKYLTLFESLQTPAILIDKDKKVSNFNHAWVNMFGIPAAPGAIYYNNASVAKQMPWLARELDDGEITATDIEKQIDTPAGPRHCQIKIKHMLDFSEKYSGTVVVLNDITDRIAAEKKLRMHSDRLEALVLKRASELLKTNQAIRREIEERKQTERENLELQKQLLHSQKMQAIGTLAGGIAHDFNNILSAILGYSELAAYEAPADSKSHDYLNEVTRACHRAKELVLQILTFSRHGEQKLKPVRVHLIAKEVLKLLRSTIPASIEIRPYLDERCGAVLADPTQIHQVLLNLCANSYHAMREKGGILAVSLKAMDLNRTQASKIDPAMEPGRYLRLSVCDTGHGMDPSILQRIFEPYFTTKAQGEGSGLGLSVIHGIVKSHHGFITAFSKPDKGATFHVYLPDFPPEKNNTILSNTDAAPKGTEHILVVDDEDVLVQILQKHLDGLGYKVTAFTDSEKALAAFHRQSERYDMVITDMSMPHMTGRQLSEKLLARRPDIPIILCTGFSEMITEEQAFEMGIKAYVLKPLLRKELAKTIRDVFDNKTSLDPVTGPLGGSGY